MSENSTGGAISTITTPSTVALRCYVENPKKKKWDSGKQKPLNPNTSTVLVFDTETTIDERQKLLFGSCGLWVNDEQRKFYVFYADDLKQKDIGVIKRYCKKHNYKVYSRSEFIEKIFIPNVLDKRAVCVAFNMPFDVSRIALRFDKPQRDAKFDNGFTFKISHVKGRPYIKIKSLNSKASFIEFTKPSYREESRQRRPRYKGCFLDLKTLAFVLTNESYSLKNALKAFGCSPKSEAKEHGVVTEEYLDYNVNDTLVTYELYQKTIERYQQYNLKKEPNLLYSPATIGKAYLEKIGIKSFFDKNPKFPKKILGYLMMTYYGGRTEVRIRKQPIKASYIDFTSMYPSIFVLLGMYDYLTANKIDPEHTKKETQEFLNNITVNDINKKETWKKFTTICKIVPDNDILPVRSRYHKDSPSTNIGINHLKSTDGTGIWYTLPDLIASKILSGKTPIIEDAITFYPKGKQKDLLPIEILKGINLDSGEDFIKKIIEERLRIKDEMKAKLKTNQKYKDSDEKKYDDTREHILKIVANATSYGIFIQVNSSNEDETKKHRVKIYGLDSFETEVAREETPGFYFNPIMSVFLTACSRLILATSESIVMQNDGKLIYCDTDSIFISSKHVNTIQEFFKPLNPYDIENLEMFKIEDEDGILMDDKWFYGISAKRYVLYDYNPNKKNNKFTIYKKSAHGLGHIMGINEKKIWENILKFHYNPKTKDAILATYENDFSISKIGISTHNILQRFRELNKDADSYQDMIKPFNFATIGTGYRKTKEKQTIIPFLSSADGADRADVPYKPFTDYKTGTIYDGTGELDTQFYWKPLSEVIGDYVNHPESKFEGDTGELKRRHLLIDKDSIAYVGKEANELDRAEVTGVLEGDETRYFDYKKILLGLSPSKDCEKLGITKRHLITLQKKCRSKESLKLTQTMREKIQKYQMLQMQS